MQIRFHLVDVFADQPFPGNPLAVVSEADGLHDSAMRSIAANCIKRRRRSFWFLLKSARIGGYDPSRVIVKN